MEKKRARAMVVFIFTIGLMTAAMLWDNTQSAELGLLQNSMRELKRVDNMQFSYVSTARGAGVQTGDQIRIWSDQLSGRWASEHYKTDEDGTRLYLKQFCDGNLVYNYIEWTGEWERQNTKDRELPYLDGILSMPYDDGDIVDLVCNESEEGTEISFGFTEEYIKKLSEERQKTVEQSYENYLKMSGEVGNAENVELSVEQYKRTREKDVKVIYHINEQDVLEGVACVISVVQPELVYNTDGQLELGKDREYSYEIAVTIEHYNQQGTLNRLEQCRNEIMYQ